MAKTSEEKTAAKGIDRYALCGVQGCCPTVEVDHAAEKLVIKDDFGGSVTLTKSEWRDALEKVRF